jgi:hypothetical protein
MLLIFTRLHSVLIARILVVTQYPSARNHKVTADLINLLGYYSFFYACRTQISGFGIGNTEFAEVC